ncbi:M23 family metallopeptidase [Chryseobacterium wangxinyae]|uniref:M23 family metallopeptidase n=1 Tax=Chryseobacterium sp. CY350 TaxID=2997336 RepID=UPI0022FD730C|nr:M23 family metallopeptidase [Chryseobacterium sp. CY350]WBZ95914.1 M23 family metallopeptidase [Chryseobacterium sp. CY350]
MKKIQSKYAFTLMLLLFSYLSFAQFNTLRPAVPKKSENQKASEKSNIEEPLNQKRNKKSWKELLNMTTKSDLISQIDSLKMMIKDYKIVKEVQRNEFEKLKDSLLLQAHNRVEETKQTSKRHKPSTTYDFVDEPAAYFSKIVMPLNNKITVTSSYGTRTHPIFGTKKMHNGIDLKARFENVYSVLDGIVTATGWDSKGGGNFIKVKHFDRFETSYLHLSEIYYRAGEIVKAGFIIGKSGNTGNSTGPHLHFSVKEFGQNINPSHFLNDLIQVNNLIANHYEH